MLLFSVCFFLFVFIWARVRRAFSLHIDAAFAVLVIIISALLLLPFESKRCLIHLLPPGAHLCLRVCSPSSVDSRKGNKNRRVEMSAKPKRPVPPSAATNTPPTATNRASAAAGVNAKQAAPVRSPQPVGAGAGTNTKTTPTTTTANVRASSAATPSPAAATRIQQQTASKPAAAAAAPNKTNAGSGGGRLTPNSQPSRSPAPAAASTNKAGAKTASAVPSFLQAPALLSVDDDGVDDGLDDGDSDAIDVLVSGNAAPITVASGAVSKPNTGTAAGANQKQSKGGAVPDTKSQPSKSVAVNGGSGGSPAKKLPHLSAAGYDVRFSFSLPFVVFSPESHLNPWLLLFFVCM